MKDFSDTTMAFTAAKGAFVLVLVNLQSVFSEILISQSQLVHCGNMIDNSEKLIQEELDILRVKSDQMKVNAVMPIS